MKNCSIRFYFEESLKKTSDVNILLQDMTFIQVVEKLFSVSKITLQILVVLNNHLFSRNECALFVFNLVLF
jgi:hypothetical protein